MGYTLHQHRVTGVITNAEGESLSNVNIFISGTQEPVAISDQNGIYSLVTTPSSRIRFSLKGYADISEPVRERSVINVIMLKEGEESGSRRATSLAEVDIIGIRPPRLPGLTPMQPDAGAEGRYATDNGMEEDDLVNIRGTISGVTLYPSGAMIVMEANAPIARGESTLLLGGLSPHIDPLSIEVTGEGNFMIMNVEHRRNYLSSPEANAEAERLRALIENLEIKREDEQMAIGVLKEEEAFLTANRTAGGQGALTATQLEALFIFYSTRIAGIRAAVLERERVVKGYNNEIAILNSQLRHISGPAARANPVGEIKIPVRASAAGEAKLRVTYVVSSAGWTPSYDIRVGDTGEPLTIVYRANIFQNTGNNWSNVTMSLSNASPTEPGVVPVLTPWNLGFFTAERLPLADHHIASYGETRRSEAALMVRGAAIAPDSLEKRASTPSAELARSANIMSFDLQEPQNLTSDGRIRSIEIERSSVRASFIHQTVPKINSAAFLTAHIDRWEELNIFGGEANIYIGNTFAGKTEIYPSGVTDTMVVSLGRDRGITVSRDRVTEQTTTSFLRGNRIDTRSFRITVRNNREDSVMVRVKDQIPVSTDSDIVVEQVELSGASLNSETGIATWMLNLAPGQRAELLLTYRVRYPRDKSVILDW